jgi:hypothetical protein
MIPLYVLMLVLLLCFILLRKASAVFDRNTSIKKIEDYLRYTLFWNSTFRYIVEGYLALTLESLTLIRNRLDWSTALK